MSYPNLLSNVQIGDLNLQNRVAMAPMTRGRSGADLTANEIIAEYYSQRASAGLLITEGAPTSILGRGWYHTPEVFTPEHAKGWRIVTEKVHQNNGLIFCQLWHAGRYSHSSFREGEPGYEGEKAISVAPSPIKRASHDGKQTHTPKGQVDVETPREMTIEEIHALPEEFRNAAQTAKDGGFDGVEVHCAAGFLLDTFLQSCTNKRTDDYGGSFENRFRIVDEVLKAMFTVYEPSRIGVKISPNGNYNDMGSDDFRESFLYFAKRLAEYGLGYLHISIGLGFGFHGKGDAMTLAEFREVYPGVIIGNCDYDAETAERTIADGHADLISFGRPFLSNPDLAEKFASGTKLNPVLHHKYWYTSAEQPWTKEGYTDLSVV